MPEGRLERTRLSYFEPDTFMVSEPIFEQNRCGITFAVFISKIKMHLYASRKVCARLIATQIYHELTKEEKWRSLS